MGKVAQRRLEMYRQLLARFVQNYDTKCYFHNKVSSCPGDLTVYDLTHTPKESGLRKHDPNLVWHHLDDSKPKAHDNWRKVPNIEDPNDYVLAHRYCHNIYNAPGKRVKENQNAEEEADANLSEGDKFKVKGHLAPPGLVDGREYIVEAVEKDKPEDLYVLKNSQISGIVDRIPVSDIDYSIENKSYIEKQSEKS